MNQLAIQFSAPCRVPDAQTQCGAILRHLRGGGSLTVAEALGQFGCYALSQRIGELKRQGWPIVAAMEKQQGGARVARYSMAQAA